MATSRIPRTSRASSRASSAVSTSQLAEALTQSESDNQALALRLSTLKTDFNVLTEKNTALMADVTQVVQERDALSTEVQATQTALDSVRATNTSLNDELTTVTGTLLESTQTLCDTQKRLAQADDDCESLKRQLDSARTDHHSELSALRAEIDRLGTPLSTSGDVPCSPTDPALTVLRDENASLRDEIQRLNGLVSTSSSPAAAAHYIGTPATAVEPPTTVAALAREFHEFKSLILNKLGDDRQPRGPPFPPSPPTAGEPILNPWGSETRFPGTDTSPTASVGGRNPRTPAITRRTLDELSAARSQRMRDLGIAQDPPPADRQADDSEPVTVPPVAPKQPDSQERLLHAIERIATAAVGPHAPSEAAGSVLHDDILITKLRTADVKGLPELVFHSTNSITMLSEARQWVNDVIGTLAGLFPWRDIGHAFGIKAESLALAAHREWKDLAPGKDRGAWRPDPARFLEASLEQSLNAVLMPHVKRLLPKRIKERINQRESARMRADALPLGAEAALLGNEYVNRLSSEHPSHTLYGVFVAVLQHAYDDGEEHRRHIRDALLQPSIPSHASHVSAALEHYEECVVTAEWLGATLPLSAKELAENVRRLLRPAEEALPDLRSDRQDYDRQNDGKNISSIDSVKIYLVDLKSLVQGYDLSAERASDRALEAVARDAPVPATGGYNTAPSAADAGRFAPGPFRQQRRPEICNNYQRTIGCMRGKACPYLHDAKDTAAKTRACRSCGCQPGAKCDDPHTRADQCKRPINGSAPLQRDRPLGNAAVAERSTPLLDDVCASLLSATGPAGQSAAQQTSTRPGRAAMCRSSAMAPEVHPTLTMDSPSDHHHSMDVALLFGRPVLALILTLACAALFALFRPFCDIEPNPPHASFVGSAQAVAYGFAHTAAPDFRGTLDSGADRIYLPPHFVDSNLAPVSVYPVRTAEGEAIASLFHNGEASLPGLAEPLISFGFLVERGGWGSIWLPPDRLRLFRASPDGPEILTIPVVDRVPRLTADLVARLRESCQGGPSADHPPLSGELFAAFEHAQSQRASIRLLGASEPRFDVLTSLHPDAIRLCLLTGWTCHELKELWDSVSDGHSFIAAIAHALRADAPSEESDDIADTEPPPLTSSRRDERPRPPTHICRESPLAPALSPSDGTPIAATIQQAPQFSLLIEHSRTHSPSMPACSGCSDARRMQAPARKRTAQRSGPALRILTLDYLGSKLPISLDGRTRLICAVCEDLFFAEALPSRAADTHLTAFLDSCWREMRKHNLAAGESWALRSDREGSLMSNTTTEFLMQRMGIRRSSPANRPTSHGVGEAAVRAGFEGMSATMIGAHAPSVLWSYAARTYAHNRTHAKTSLKPGSYEGPMLPFGIRGRTTLPSPTRSKAASQAALGQPRTSVVAFLQVDATSAGTIVVLFVADGVTHTTTVLARGVQWEDCFAFPAPSVASQSFAAHLDGIHHEFSKTVSDALDLPTPLDSVDRHPDSTAGSDSSSDSDGEDNSDIDWIQCHRCRKWRVTNPAQIAAVECDEQANGTRVECTWLGVTCSAPQWDPRTRAGVAKLLRDAVGPEPSEGDSLLAKALISLAIPPRDTRRGPYSQLDWPAADQDAVEALRRAGAFGRRLTKHNVAQIPNAIIVYAHFVRVIKHFELGQESWKIKSRFVGSRLRQFHASEEPSVRPIMSALPAGMREFCIFVITALAENLEIELADVECAYPVSPKNGPPHLLQLDERNADLFGGRPGEFLEILKALPGIPDAGEDWDIFNSKCLLSSNYVRDKDIAPSVWRRPEGTSWGGLLFYVDDGARAGTPAANAAAWTELSQFYNLSAPTNLGRMLGSIYTHIALDTHKRILRIDQTEYWQHTVQAYVDDGGSIDGPALGMPSAPDESSVRSPRCQNPRRHIGKLLFGQRSSAPHLKYAVRVLACRVHAWTDEDEARLARIMRFLAQNSSVHDLLVDTRDQGSLGVVYYADSDFGTEIPSRYSTSSYDVYIVGPHGTRALVESASARQTSASLSTPESEVDAIVRGARAAIGTQLLIEFLTQRPSARGCLSDAQSAILAVKKGHSAAMRHTRVTQGVSISWAHRHVAGRDGGDAHPYSGRPVRIHEGRGSYTSSCILAKVPTGVNVSDVGTKPVPLATYRACMRAQGLRAPATDGPTSAAHTAESIPEAERELTQTLANALAAL